MPTMQAIKAIPRARRTTPAAKQSHVFTKFVGSIKVKPQAEQKLSLGNYSPQNPAKGYSIRLKSRADTDGPDISTDIVMSGSTKRYELTLLLTNGSDKSVSAEVWQM